MEPMESPSHGYKTIAHFLAATTACVFMFAFSLATLVTLGLKGWPILAHGVPMCAVVAQANLWGQVLYTSCGCALVILVVLIPLSILGLKFSTPRLIRQFRHMYEDGRRRRGK